MAVMSLKDKKHLLYSEDKGKGVFRSRGISNSVQASFDLISLSFLAMPSDFE